MPDSAADTPQPTTAPPQESGALRRARAWWQARQDARRPHPDEPDRKRRRYRALAWTGGIIGVLVVAVVLFLAFFDWNYLRGPISRYASAKTGREVAIDGNLRVKLLSWTPSATVEGLRIGHPAWAGPGRTADIERIAVQVKLLPLLKGDVILPLLEFDKPNLQLIADAQGRKTWDFSKGEKKQDDKPFKLPPIRRFIIDDGRIRFSDAKRGLTLNATINATEQMGATNRGFVLAGDGGINKAPFLLNVVGGPLLNVDTDKPYPFDADIRAGATRITAKGKVPEPFDLGQLDVNLTVRGPDLEDLYSLTGIALPNTPPYRLSGRLVRDDRLYKVTGLKGEVGDSDMSGSLSVDTGRERPFLKADLRSRLLDFDDLASIFGGAPSTAPGETVSDEQKVVARQLAAEQRILPDATLKVERIRAMDADVNYRADSIRAPKLPLRGAQVHVKLNEGVLDADPLRFDLPQGNIAGKVRLDARKATPVTTLDVRLSNARLEQLIPIKAGGQPLTGSFVGRVKLTGEGNSVHRAFANADGEVLAVVPGGQIRQAFAELLGINVVRGLGLLLSKDQQQTPINCAVAHFQAKDGVLTANQIIFDTGPVLGKGSGSIDLETERLSFRIEGDPKEPRLIRLMAPITLNGPIKKPKVGIEPGKAIVQGVVAAALATVASPLAVILPFVDPGLAKDAACGALIANAGKEGVPVKSARR